MPYKTSSGNINLGPAPFESLKTNVQLIGKPNANAPELIPLDKTGQTGDAWLRASANKTYENTPILATVRGMIKEALPENRNTLEKGTTSDVLNKEESLGPYELHDDGYGVDRTLNLISNNSTVAIRTSTKNRVSFIELPEDARSYTGVLSYYSTWQLQLRDTNDVSEN